MAKVTERKLVSFDWAVKKLLRSKANFGVLKWFLSELLFDDIKILEILESESNKDNEDDKYNRVDIKVKNSKDELLIIEVQTNNEWDFFHRILYATSKTICEHLDEGEPYSNVVKVISVNILYFNLGEGNDYIYRGKTQFKSFHNDSDMLKLNQKQMEKFNKVYPGEIFPEYYIIKVNNFNDVAKNTLDEWIYLLKNSAIKSDFKARGIQKAGRILDRLKMTIEERLAYDNYIYHKRAARGDFETALDEAMEKEAKKLEDKYSKKLQEKDKELQEEKNKFQEMAKFLLENGFSKEEILKKTGIKL